NVFNRLEKQRDGDSVGVVRLQTAVVTSVEELDSTLPCWQQASLEMSSRSVAFVGRSKQWTQGLNSEERGALAALTRSSSSSGPFKCPRQYTKAGQPKQVLASKRDRRIIRKGSHAVIRSRRALCLKQNSSVVQACLTLRL
ncbi:hypothetical protein P7K49_005556, partial [Saguinus oedipus]